MCVMFSIPSKFQLTIPPYSLKEFTEKYNSFFPASMLLRRQSNSWDETLRVYKQISCEDAWSEYIIFVHCGPRKFPTQIFICKELF